MVKLAFTEVEEAPLYFNLHGPIGKGYPASRQDDVLFVQYCFVVHAAKATVPQAPDILGKVELTGAIDDATVNAILFWQKFLRKTFSASSEVDGIVSTVKGGSHGSVFYRGGAHYAIFDLNIQMMADQGSIWPRLDKDPRCPAALGASIRTALGAAVKP